MGELQIPKRENMSSDNADEKFLITSVVSDENNKEYFLYSDGNLYEKDANGKLVVLEKVTPESKKIADKIMQKFKAGKTDIINSGKNTISRKKEIDVDYPEL